MSLSVYSHICHDCCTLKLIKGWKSNRMSQETHKTQRTNFTDKYPGDIYAAMDFLLHSFSFNWGFLQARWVNNRKTHSRDKGERQHFCRLSSHLKPVLHNWDFSTINHYSNRCQLLELLQVFHLSAVKVDAEQNGLFDSAVLTQPLQYRLSQWEDGMMGKVQRVCLPAPDVGPKARGFVIQKILLSDATAERWHVSHEHDLLQLGTLRLGAVTGEGEGGIGLFTRNADVKTVNDNSGLFWKVNPSQCYFESFDFHGNQCLAWSLAHIVLNVCLTSIVLHFFCNHSRKK